MTHPPETDASSGGFEISQLTTERGRQITVIGELDLASAPRLRDAYLTVAEPGDGHLVLDLAGVTFIDSTGIHALIGAYEAYPDKLSIITSPVVSRMLAVCGLRSRLPVAES